MITILPPPPPPPSHRHYHHHHHHHTASPRLLTMPTHSCTFSPTCRGSQTSDTPSRRHPRRRPQHAMGDRAPCIPPPCRLSVELPISPEH
ncbi:hypothetical protein E2C01_077360 [Portunus trituberculatus]|uniref:Uncharacterized protein n=1 Tax=Portunus trituberculatus TaxID=210409 RepID=A0A5B7IB93_PORTR|nr:hypothetical protein [Portunus trituberculatus]